MKKTVQYIVINSFVLILSVLLFLHIFQGEQGNLLTGSWYEWLIPTGTVIAVQILKVCRLYLELHESEMGIPAFLGIYCKVTPVSMILPYKSGELFRMYCFGRETGSSLKGIVVILLDRFMDTIALLTTILFIGLFHGGIVSPPLIFMFLSFLGCILPVYFLFPGIYLFWNRRFLREDAEEKTLRMLKFLKTMNRIYREIRMVTKGRGLMLYILSAVAWYLEIGSVYLIGRLSGEASLNELVSSHLFAALNGTESLYMKRYIAAGTVLMIGLALIIRGIEVVRRRKDTGTEKGSL